MAGGVGKKINRRIMLVFFFSPIQSLDSLMCFYLFLKWNVWDTSIKTTDS